MLNIALPKGRLGDKVYDMFEAAGYECPQIKEKTRKLIFENEEKQVRYFWVKPSDLADLNVGKCRMCVAGPKDFRDSGEKKLKVATKFTNTARQYYAQSGRDIDIIKLNGSIEIAPILGLSDVIVDLVETGTTLKKNDLAVLEVISSISARLIANKASFKFKNKEIETVVSRIKEQIKID